MSYNSYNNGEKNNPYYSNNKEYTNTYNEYNTRNDYASQYTGQLDFPGTELIWLNGYSVKFQGCHHVNHWNENVSGREDVRLYTKRMAIFRLCPTDQCHGNPDSAGCTSGYGEYIVDLSTFLTSYYANNDNMMRSNNINGNNENLYYNSHHHPDHNSHTHSGTTISSTRGGQFYHKSLFPSQMMQYLECAPVPFPPPSDEKNVNDQPPSQYYVGPYCAAQGGSVHLGIFTDAACTIFASGNPNELSNMVAALLIHGSSSMSSEDDNDEEKTKKAILNLFDENTSLIHDENDCQTCARRGEEEVEKEDANEKKGRLPNEMCYELYQLSGKCEDEFPLNSERVIHENACEYLEHIKIVRMTPILDEPSVMTTRLWHRDGNSNVSVISPNGTITAMIGIFGVAFVALLVTVRRLKRRVTSGHYDASYSGNGHEYSLVELVSTD